MNPSMLAPALFASVLAVAAERSSARDHARRRDHDQARTLGNDRYD